MIRNQWTQEEIELLRNNYRHGTKTTMASLLPAHPYNSIRKKAYKLGIRRHGTELEIDEDREILAAKGKSVYVKVWERSIIRELSSRLSAEELQELVPRLSVGDIELILHLENSL